MALHRQKVYRPNMHGRRGTPAGPVEPLTHREVEVLRALGEGLSSPEVSEELGITRNTLRTHLHNIMGKLGARSKLEAVLTAIRMGIVEPPRAS